MQFLRRGSDPEPAVTVEERPTSQQAKGRATPSRKDAEAARKQTLKIPTDPKAAKKAARQRSSQDRATAQAALRSGDDRYLPARDAGPLKAFARQYVDSRISAGEFFIPVAVAILLLGFVKVTWVSEALVWVWLLMLFGVVADSFYLWFRFSRVLPEKFPDQSRKGVVAYAIMRSLQIRRLRLPKPKFKAGGRPVVRKS
ncbi:MAG TPA: DUF3043 domain-containing protein [Candidatus Nanopelagicales bacterium]|jgi:hypothetical protein